VIDYAAENAQGRKFRAALTRAINSKDPYKVINAVNVAEAYYEQPGKIFPDAWARWERAREDAVWTIKRQPLADTARKGGAK
jgi:hypothetical protein